MQKHTKIVIDAHASVGIDPHEIQCEIPGCGRIFQDVHHIECRGMGGTTRDYGILDLMALCRDHHNQYGDKVKYLERLKAIHLRYCQFVLKSNLPG